MATKNTLIVKGFELPLFIGVYAWERKHRQIVSLNLRIRLDGAMLHVPPLLDYDQLLHKIHSRFAHKTIEWIEQLAEEVAAFTLSQEGVGQVKVGVKKRVISVGNPSVLGVEITRP